eukprot:gnl/TRDRNA2_/TRDRNA2_144770_c1_seq1.p1 gnl/TRDRNA2_/TRDRNA2_144770_c1~~gnl/TRDRNA2_/TRDRNA2_144770_c1_seq1.p1  ORF type:complete len:449 (+),score=58.14 gnl/TRDRNA2_/TRDRNA2_144770_c1_seq1:40-1347(+)
MSALRLDVPLLIDTALIYGFESMPSRLPSLAYLVETVLGRHGFRGADGQSCHDCKEDATSSMQLVLHRLRHPSGGKAPQYLVPAPGLQQIDESASCTLLVHRIADRPGVRKALVKLFSSIQGRGAGGEVGSMNIMKSAQGWRVTTVKFATPEGAREAFASLSAAAPSSKDRQGRPQKLVQLVLKSGEKLGVYVRAPAVVPTSPSDTPIVEVAPASSQASKAKKRSVAEALEAEIPKDEAAKKARATHSDASSKSIPCKFFAENRCSRGSACPFLHSGASGGATVALQDCSTTVAANGQLGDFLREIGLEKFKAAVLQATGLLSLQEILEHTESIDDIAELATEKYGMKMPQVRKLWKALEDARSRRPAGGRTLSTTPLEPVQEGERIRVKWMDGKWHKATIHCKNNDGTFKVIFAEDGSYESKVPMERIRRKACP